MAPLEEKELTNQIIGCAISVHKELGPGFLESIYENALELELMRSGLQVEKQKCIHIYYAGKQVGEHRLDLLVNNRIVVELKTIKEFENIHFSIVRSYLKATELKHGLLLNFARETLQVKRVTTISKG